MRADAVILRSAAHLSRAAATKDVLKRPRRCIGPGLSPVSATALPWPLRPMAKLRERLEVCLEQNGTEWIAFDVVQAHRLIAQQHQPTVNSQCRVRHLFPAMQSCDDAKHTNTLQHTGAHSTKLQVVKASLSHFDQLVIVAVVVDARKQLLKLGAGACFERCCMQDAQQVRQQL